MTSRAMSSRARQLATLVLVVLGLVACEPESEPSAPNEPIANQPEPAPEPEPPEPKPDLAAQTDALVQTLEALGRVHDEHADDCPALALALTDFHAEQGASLAQASPELMARIDADPALRQRVQTAMEAVMSASMACKDDPSFASSHALRFPTPSGPLNRYAWPMRR